MPTDMGTLTPEQMLQQQQILRQQKMAEMLMQQGMEQPKGQMISGHYVAPSIFQNLAGLANTYVGQKGIEKGDQAQLDLAKAVREQKMGVLESLNKALDEKDLPKARAIATANPEIAGQFAAPLIANAIPKPTELKQNYQDWLDSGGKGTLLDYQRYTANLKAEHPSYSHIETPQGVYIMNSRTGQMMPAVDAQGKPIMGKGKSLTEAEGKATTYQGTMMNAAKNMKALEDKGYNPASFKNQAQLSAPHVGNIAIPSDSQQYKQAMSNFANAYLRFQSGANMGEKEIQNNLREMMPVFGDKPDVIKQKADAREQAIRFMSYSAGQGANMLQNALPNAPAGTVMPTNPAAIPAVPAVAPAKPAEVAPQTAYMGNRKIVVRGNGWVYEDNGQAVK
jgi:hypothetical protein